MHRSAWLFSAYGADSHRRWARWLTSAVDVVSWRTWELPGRHFRWRIRGNPLSWLDSLPDAAPDRLVATSMVDLATFRGLHPRLAAVPTVYYFHENQFSYPASSQQVRSVDPQMVQLYGALAADELVFNSRFNRDSFLTGVDALLARLPDAVPAGVTARLAPKCRILPVPVTPIAPASSRDPELVLWNHRWDYDKAPELFAEAMIALAERGVSFRLALLGHRHHNTPPALERLRAVLGARIVADGRVPRERYERILGQAAVVVSTAEQEFQGLSVLEAASAGARPLVPDALCYPEQYPAAHRYPPGDAAALADRLETWLTRGPPPALDVAPWLADRLLGPWRALITKEPGSGIVDG